MAHPCPPHGALLLRAAMAAGACTETELARALGVTQQAVSGWLHGRCRPSTPLMAAVEARFGIPMRTWLESAPKGGVRKAAGRFSARAEARR